MCLHFDLLFILVICFSKTIKLTDNPHYQIFTLHLSTNDTSAPKTADFSKKDFVVFFVLVKMNRRFSRLTQGFLEKNKVRKRELVKEGDIERETS